MGIFTYSTISKHIAHILHILHILHVRIYQCYHLQIWKWKVKIWLSITNHLRHISNWGTSLGESCWSTGANQGCTSMLDSCYSAAACYLEVCSSLSSSIDWWTSTFETSVPWNLWLQNSACANFRTMQWHASHTLNILNTDVCSIISAKVGIEYYIIYLKYLLHIFHRFCICLSKYVAYVK